ncbi:hypothetical protein ACGFX4_16105 [Kitasatospora sp. NPDC048365]|uniref:hypothetical protein n=1 Tax=Kitasatospora sp. NPDC048365 TaxID=3364050 RepID=UPI003718BE77
MTAIPEDAPAPVLADTELAELRRLGARALDCRQAGDLQGARDAAGEAGTAAAAAVAALGGLLELETAAEQQPQPIDGDTSHWLG